MNVNGLNGDVVANGLIMTKVITGPTVPWSDEKRSTKAVNACLA